MADKKRLALTLGAMALTAALAVGGTLAYLSSVTETKTNTFSSSKDVSTNLTEDKWDENKGNNYSPGEVLYKNPVLTNTSASAGSIYTAIKLEYIDNEGNHVDYAKFSTDYAAVDAFNANWEKIGTDAQGNDLYVYKTTLEKGKATDPIFTQVTVNTGISEVWTQKSKEEQVYRVEADGTKTLVNTATTVYDKTFVYVDAQGNKIDKPAQLPQFQIKATGYAIQADEMDAATAKIELAKLAKFTAVIK